MNEIVDSALDHLERARKELIDALAILNAIIGVFQHVAKVLEEYEKKKEG